MKTTVRTVVFAALMGFVATASSASFFDGKRPLLCSVYQLFECDAPNACLAVTPEQIGGVSHLNIDFKNKTITRAGVESKQTSTIDSVETIDSKLILSGIEDGEAEVRDGAGWTISIMDPEGTMVMAVAGDGFAVVGLGACVPKP
ncbi:MAG: hypothetical protein OEU49_07030 [Chromatiales bacterium]|jgi:hypothetical protein|nr:hypothetical protein [Chromatiales bacterium]